MAAEVLEARAMLAVTADLVGGDLLISYNEPGDLAADISSDGGFYTVSGTGLAATQFAIGGPAGVTGRIVVQDSAAILGQSFTVETGTPLANPLQVSAGVELTTLVGGILTSVPGDVLLGSGVITLGNTISTALTGSSVTFGGATTLAGPVAISTGGGSGDISFQGTIDGGQTLSLTAGIGNVIFGGAVGGGTPLAGISLTSAASMTAASTIALDGTPGLATDGIAIDAGVNRVSLTKAGSSIQNFSANGIWFKGGSTDSTISGFTIKGNGGDGVRLDAGGYSGTTISNNSISDNDGNGVRLTAATGPVSIVENSKIDLNGLNGVYAENSTTVSIVGNSIVGNTFHGVSVPGGGGVIVGNEIADNGSNGVMLAGGYDVADNLISLNDRHGIEVVTGLTSLDITGNTINGNGLDGIFFDVGGVTGFEVSGNAIYGNKSDGIQADNGDYTGTAIQGNELYENVQNGIFLNATADLTSLLIGGVESKYGNEIYANTENGVFVAGSTMGATTFTDTKLLLNTIDSNGEYGVFLEDARAPGFADGLLIGRNTVTANVAGGIALDTSTGHRIIGNTVTGYAAPPAVDGISLTDRSDANVVYSNVVNANGGNGIVVDSSDGVEVGGAIGGFTTTAGGTVLTLAGDQTALILPGMQVGLAPPVLDPPLGVVRTVVAVSLVGGSTQVTVSEPMDTTSTSGTLGGSNTADGNGGDGIVAENSLPTLIVGNVATGNAGAGIAVSGGGGTIASNVAAGNGGSGIELGGGYGVSSNNVYSNAGDGILVATGLNDLPINNNWIYDNGGNGISFTGGVTGFSVFRNDIGQDPFNNPAGNGGFGVRFDAGDYSSTQLFDNKETTGVEGGTIAYNALDGVFLNASSSPNGAITGLTIGGTKDDGNSIHDNGRSGILVSAGSYTGTTIQGNELYQNTDHGVFLSVNTTAGLTGLLIGGDQNGLGNWIDSNGRNGMLAQPTAGGADSYADTVIVGNEVTRNRFDGIRLAGGATSLSLTGNLIGTRADDDSAIAWGNLQSGVRVRAGDYADTVIQGNELKGNGEYGVSLDAAGGDLTGLLIGGEQAGLGNWMDSNGRNGVLVRPTGGGVSSYADTVIVGNEVTRNRFDGVRLVGDIENLSLTGNWIGTRAVDDLVTKWGNLQSGVRVRAGDYAGTTIQGNEIKTNGDQGVFLERGVTNLLVGGERADLGNRINLNSRNGILATAGSYTGTVIVGNMILDNGDKAGRVGNGILVEGSDLTIGWTDQAGEPNPVANTIAANALNGIEIRGVAAKANSILSNAMYLNGAVDTGVPGAQTVAGKGIALTEGGNDGQAAPVILRVVDDAVGSVVRVLATVPASGSYYVQVFANTPADERGIFPADTNGFEGRTLVADSPAQNGETVTTAKPMIAGVLVTGETLVMIEIPANRVAPGDWLTATATRVEGGIAGSTSPFSAGVQLPNAPVLAAGGDGPSTWSPEYPFTTLSPSQIQVNGLSLAYQQALASLENVDVILTPADVGAGGNVIARVLGGRISGGSVILDLAPEAPAPVGTGTFALGSVTLPAARLYDASQPTATPVLLDLDAARIAQALRDASVDQNAANSFVNRFQGGLRVAHADIDGDGFADLVTAPGAAPPALNKVFGNATRVVSIYNGNVGSGAWRSASVNVSEVFGTAYTGGFTLALADVNPERSGSGSAVAELVVASTNMVAVFEVTVTTRGGQPAINSTPLVTWASSARVTGVTAGDFSEAETDEIVVATTTIPSGNAVPPKGDSTRTAAVVTMAVVGQQLVPRNSFTIWSEVVNGPPGPGYVQNVFYNGASLAVGDIDGTIIPGADGIRLRPELVLAVAPMGLANFRVLANQLVSGGSQSAIDEALGPNGLYAQPPRQPDGATWQPTGGPDYFVGTTVPVPIAGGANAALSVAVVDTDGRANARAEVFAAIGATTTTNNVVRKLVWGGPTVRSWAAVGEFMVRPGAGSLAKTKFPLGFGLRLG